MKTPQNAAELEDLVATKKLIAFDHAKLVDRDIKEVSRFRRFVESHAHDKNVDAAMMHDASEDCCRRENFKDTVSAIFGSCGLGDVSTESRDYRTSKRRYDV